MTAPAGDPMTAGHLLGDGWESHRWYRTEAERDHAYREMERQPVYYRRGDSPSVILERVERDAGG